MRKKHVIVNLAKVVILVLITFIIYQLNCPGEQGTTFKVMSYNIHHGVDMDGKIDLGRIARVIRQAGTDIVGLNEVDNNFSPRSDFVDQAKWLAEELGMNYVYGPAIIRGDPEKPSQYGEAILSKFPILEWKNHRLFFPEGLGPKVCLEAKIQIGTDKYTFLVTHLDHTGNNEARVGQAKDILRITKLIPCKKILMGDFNCSSPLEWKEPEMAKWTQPVALILKQFKDAFALSGSGLAETIGSKAPMGRIDYIFVSADIADMVEFCKVVHTPLTQVASDHLPVVAEINTTPPSKGERKPFDFKKHRQIIESFKRLSPITVQRRKEQKSVDRNITIHINPVESAKGTIGWHVPPGCRIKPATFDFKIKKNKEAIFPSHLTVVKDIKDLAYYKVTYASQETQTYFYRGVYLSILSKPKKTVCPKITIPPKIDGRLNDGCWKEMAILKDFVFHKDGEPASEQTIGHLGYDDKNLYIAFKCLDLQVENIVAYEKEHDGRVWEDDAIEIFLDTNHDKNSYYHLITNSIGTQFNQLRNTAKRITTPKDEKWNANWEIKTSVEENYWAVEIAIPFKELGIKSPKSGEVWGVNFARSYRGRECSQWSCTFGGNHTPKRFGNVRFE